MSVVDALRHGRHTDALASLMEILYEHTETIVEYVDHPILALDQPAHLRERCENRALEFSEHFKVALERGEAFGEQAKLLLSYDELIAGLDGQSIVLMDGFLRTVNDFRPTQLIKFESLPAMGYAGNVKLLAQRVNELRAQNYCVALLAGGVADVGRVKSMARCAFSGVRVSAALRRVSSASSNAPFTTSSPTSGWEKRSISSRTTSGSSREQGITQNTLSSSSI